MRPNSNRPLFFILIFFFFALKGNTHPFGHWLGGGQSAVHSTSNPSSIYAKMLPSVIAIDKDNVIKYAFFLPEGDLVDHLPSIDKDGDTSISQTEFQEGFVKVDKWVRPKVSASSRLQGIVGWLFDKRGNCEAKKIDYDYVGEFMNEKIYSTAVVFKCPGTKNVMITNELQALFRPLSKGMLLNVILKKKDGSQTWLEDLEKNKIHVGDL